MINKFKRGDKVVCISKDIIELSKANAINHLEVEKIYEIIDIRLVSDGRLAIKINNDIKFFYSEKRFVSLHDYRKMKINKINENS